MLPHPHCPCTRASIGGSVSNFAAPRASEAALKLELAARVGELDRARALLPELESELERLRQGLAALRAGEAV